MAATLDHSGGIDDSQLLHCQCGTVCRSLLASCYVHHSLNDLVRTKRSVGLRSKTLKEITLNFECSFPMEASQHQEQTLHTTTPPKAAQPPPTPYRCRSTHTYSTLGAWCDGNLRASIDWRLLVLVLVLGNNRLTPLLDAFHFGVKLDDWQA